MSKLRILTTALLSFLLGTVVYGAIPPHRIDISFGAPSTAAPVDGYNVYVDDCDSAGPTGAPIGTAQAGQTTPFNDVFPDIGTYEVCIRGFNATGEQPAVTGQVATVVATNQLPGVIENLDVQFFCLDGAGNEIPCADTGIDITITIN